MYLACCDFQPLVFSVLYKTCVHFVRILSNSTQPLMLVCLSPANALLTCPKDPLHADKGTLRVCGTGKNIMTKNQVGEERVYSAYTFHIAVGHQRMQDWNSSRSGGRSWCRGHGGMFLTGLLPLAFSACFLIEPKITSPRMAPHTMGPPSFNP
jgi:hypothetical protein